METYINRRSQRNLNFKIDGEERLGHRNKTVNMKTLDDKLKIGVPSVPVFPSWAQGYLFFMTKTGKK